MSGIASTDQEDETRMRRIVLENVEIDASAAEKVRHESETENLKFVMVTAISQFELYTI